MFILNINELELLEHARLPYRRVLGTIEHKTWHEAVNERWGKWYGGSSDRVAANSEVVTLHDAVMDDPRSYQHLRNALLEKKLPTIFELREYGDGCELSIESAGFEYNGAEGFWTDRDLGSV